MSEKMDEIYRKAAENFLDTFITPEVIKRQDASELDKPLDLRAAQIIFYSDERIPEIRINSEVKAFGKMKLKDDVSKNPGDPVYENELEGFEDLYLSPDDDPNAGHATLLKIGSRWFLSFDFIYNKGLAGKHIEVAKQFLTLAEFALRETYLVAFIDNLFSASELLAKTQLMTLWSNPQFQKKPHTK